MAGTEEPTAGTGQDGFDQLWAELAPIGRDGRTGGYRRFAWTREDAALREWFVARAAACGLDVTADRAGNLWAWWGDPDADGPGVVVGSHLDSVPDGGAFDGPLGVVSALLAVAALRARGVRPRRPVGVACFGDEEGARFGVACAGSRVLTGALAADRALALTDSGGVRMADALSAAGRDLRAFGADPDAVRRVGCYLELHVEQGRALADPALGLDRAVAVGTSIHPHGRWRFDLPGRADHAGTTRLADRTDPMLTLASVVVTARDAAIAGGCLATVGRIAVEPNATNAVPSRVTAWLDSRGEDEAAVREVVARVAAAAGVASVEESFTAATRFDAALTAHAARLLDGAPLLATGAGHDAGVLAAAGIRATMLFVRNPTGVSHAPDEHAERDDCLAGVEALATVLADLATSAALPSPGPPVPPALPVAGGAGASR